MLTNLNCQYLKFESKTLENFFDSKEDYKDIKITLRKNCCESLTYTTEISDLTSSTWRVKLFTAADESANIIGVNGVFVKNLITGVETKISSFFLYGDQGCGSNFTDTQNEISAWFTAAGVTPPTFNTVVEDGSCYLEIIDVPFPYAMTRVEYKRYPSGPLENSIFSYGETGTGFFISGDALYIGPEIMGLSSFTNGIYTATITYTQNNNSTIVESSCLFVDCDIKCRVAEKLDTLKTESLLHIIYFALLQASNCDCQCSKLCALYEELLVELGDITTSSDCGC